MRLQNAMATTKRRARPDPTRAAAGSRGAKRNGETLSRSLLHVFADDFKSYGADVVAKMRDKDPTTYLKLCLQILPKQDEADRPLGRVSDEELEYLERLLAERGDRRPEPGDGEGG